MAGLPGRKVWKMSRKILWGKTCSPIILCVPYVSDCLALVRGEREIGATASVTWRRCSYTPGHAELLFNKWWLVYTTS